MGEVLIRRGLFWLLQWVRLAAACIAILTFGFVDLSLKAEGAYLDFMTYLATHHQEPNDGDDA